MYINPDVDQFKAYYPNFPYGTTPENVTDQNVQQAIYDSAIFIQPLFFSNQDAYTQGFFWLSAHFLVMNLRAQTTGLQGQAPWLQSGKGVGSVNESFAIPQRILDNPELALLSKTYYGQKYLFFILPQLTGVCFTVYGRTHA